MLRSLKNMPTQARACHSKSPLPLGGFLVLLDTMNYRGKRVLVMGLGHFGGGAAAARWLAEQGAEVTITDLASETSLAEPLTGLVDVPIHAFHLGGHDEEDFRRAELVVVNPAVRPHNPFLNTARRAGARLTSEIGLFLEVCPASIIGVTGSNGKSTTAAMIARLLRHDRRRAWLGGNLGGSLLGEVGRMQSDDWVVLELSSFQLKYLPAEVKMLRVAVVTNCTPNHLDWHDDYDDYVSTKQRILTDMPHDGLVVLGRSLLEDESWMRLAGRRRLELIDSNQLGPLHLLGKHNRENAVCAVTVALGVGCTESVMTEGLRTFSGLPGRLEKVATIRGRDFYNDTTATTPESTMAALESFDRPVWLLAGGHDKGIDMGPLFESIVANAKGAAFYGKMGPCFQEEISRRSKSFSSVCRSTMAEAFGWCWTSSCEGDVIVLSPACSSHDQFRNFQQRGSLFVDLVLSLEKEGESYDEEFARR